MVWRMNIARIDIARMWPGVYAWTGLTLACSQREKSAHCSCICHACIHTYIQHTYIPTVLPSRSFTTSFVFPSFSDPATTFETHYWKKLTCGVIRSFNSGTKKHGEIISCRNYQMAMNLCPPISDIYIYIVYMYSSIHIVGCIFQYFQIYFVISHSCSWL